MNKRAISRRQFLVGTAAAAGGVAVLLARRSGLPAVHGLDPTPTPAAVLPYVSRNYHPPRPALPGRVVRVHNPAATHWEGEGDYWNHAAQEAIDGMVESGLMALTGVPSLVGAWRTLIPNYQPGERIAIKVNFNNCMACNSTYPTIDAILEPVNALARGLVQMGVSPGDIWVYDAVRALPDRFVGRDQYGLTFFDGRDPPCRLDATFTLSPDTRVDFFPPEGVTMPEEHVTDVLMGADYLINLPIMKGGHPLAGVTLGFKNHFGTINSCSLLHDYVNVVGLPPGYRTDYNPLVDLIRSPLIGGKTVLTVGDAIFAARHFNDPPAPWTTFGDELPNSLLFSADPVAVDCVMHDLIVAEPETDVPDGANNYLLLAGAAGLGVYEQGEPWGSGYDQIEYVIVEM